MLIDWPRFLFALALLLIPIGLFHSERVRYRALIRDWDGHWRRSLTLGLHSVDLARAVLGGWLLLQAVSQAPEFKGVNHLVLVVQASVMLVAMTLQASICRERGVLHAPFAFAAGLVFGFLPLLVGAFALPLAVALSLMAVARGGFFAIFALAVCVVGFFFAGRAQLPALVAVSSAVAFPWLIGLLFRRHFVSTYRGRPRDAPSAPPR